MFNWEKRGHVRMTPLTRLHALPAKRKLYFRAYQLFILRNTITPDPYQFHDFIFNLRCGGWYYFHFYSPFEILSNSDSPNQTLHNTASDFVLLRQDLIALIN